jgi:NTP pyrophosphatase (non-canonical NTP hydrolase)
MASEIDSITSQLITFRNERDWEQFHNPKDLAIAISAEAGELLECFLWKDADDAKLDKIKEELADVLAYSLLLAHRCGLNVTEIVEAKIRKNAEKYPIEKAKGSAKKYDEL